jgi:hypothetical protein
MLALCLALSFGAASSADSDDDAVDLLAPYFGVTPLDADDLVEDAQDEPNAEPKKRLKTGREGPLWTAMIPELHLKFEYHDLESTGLSSVHFTANRGVVILVSASFGGAAAPQPRALPGVRLAALVSEPAPSGPVDPRTPSVAEVQEAAERAALVHLADLAGWRSRARTAAWLPSLEADYRRNVGEIDTLGVQSNLGIDSHNLEDVSRYGVKASWQLSQIVFSSEEITAASTALELEQRRQDLVAHVTELYFERLRTLAKERDAAGREAEALELRAAELTAKIDALTNGFLSLRLAERESAQ